MPFLSSETYIKVTHYIVLLYFSMVFHGFSWYDPFNPERYISLLYNVIHLCHMTSRMKERRLGWLCCHCVFSFCACSNHSRDDESRNEKSNVIVFREDHGGFINPVWRCGIADATRSHQHEDRESESRVHRLKLPSKTRSVRCTEHNPTLKILDTHTQHHILILLVEKMSTP